MVQDTFILAKKLGIPHLWVDSLCIIHDDERSRKQQIDQMHVIYHRSAMTIVAAAGRDSNAGLVSLSRARTMATPQYVANVGPFPVVATSISTYSDLLATHWRSRGWTLQEE